MHKMKAYDKVNRKTVNTKFEAFFHNRRRSCDLSFYNDLLYNCSKWNSTLHEYGVLQLKPNSVDQLMFAAINVCTFKKQILGPIGQKDYGMSDTEHSKEVKVYC